MPANFQFPLMGVANIWTPLAFDDKQRADRNMSWFAAFGRLKPGVTQDQAGAELATIASHLEKQYPQTNTNQTTLLHTMAYEIGQNEGSTQTLICFWIVGLVLLIACANVANLMLARATRRAKEFAVRAALGASRARLIRQLLTESMMLFSVGAVGGALFAAWCVNWIAEAIPSHIRGYLVNYGRADLDLTTLAYTLAVALFCGALFGLAPAFEGAGLDVNRALKEASGQASASRRGARLRRAFVVGEIAMAVVVLISTVLLVESFAHMVFGNLGFQPKNVQATQLVVPPTKYKTDAQVRTFYDQVMARVRALPEVVSAGATVYLPFGESNQTLVIHVVGRPPEDPGEVIGANYTAITPDYLSTMQIPLLRGRWIEPSDASGAQNVILINETLARQQFSKEDPLGHQLDVGDRHTIYTIVGVVQDVKQSTLSERPRRQIYASAAQFPSPYMGIVARSARPAPALAAAIRGAVWSVDPDQPVSAVRPLDDMITERNTPNRILAQIVGFFGLLALLLGALGIYALMAQSVAQRTHEIGIRMALGSTSGAVLRLIVGQGLRLTLAGIAVGLLAAAGVTRGLASMLYEVKASDPLTFVAVAAFFAFVALAACYIPARRGARVDPMVALRYE